jgi:hypothetical protein
MSSTNATYLRWLARRWEEHNFASFYRSTEHENQRTEEVLHVLVDIRELSKRSIESTTAGVNGRQSRGSADNNRRCMRWLEARRDYFKSSTPEEARKEEVLEIFRGLSTLARQRFRVR